MEKAYFPMDILHVTQGENGNASHKGSLAMDFGGKDTGADKIYAPCTMRIVRVRKDSSHEIYAESVEPVQWADGTADYMNFTFMHDNSINANVKTGAIIRQGEYFADEGGFGRGQAGRFANHLHLEVGKGKSPARQVKNSAGTPMTPGQVHIYNALFLKPDTIIRNDGKYPWKTDAVEDDMKYRLYQVDSAYLTKETAIAKFEERIKAGERVGLDRASSDGRLRLGHSIRSAENALDLLPYMGDNTFIG